MKRFGISLLAGLVGCSAAVAQDAASFQGKTVSMIIGYASGGGTDAFGRLAAAFLANYLPGSPKVVVRNIPGADGITAMNYFVQQVAPDGYTVTMASSTQADPLVYRQPQSHFDPTTLAIVGGVGRGGSAIIIGKEAEKRLHDPQARPVIMGAPSGIPRSGMQMTAWGIEFLGWNAKWVIGYRGTNELVLALERGEIDMTSTGNLFQIQKLIESGKFKILAQTGTLKNGAIVARPDFGAAPILENMLQGRLGEPLARKAFGYWGSIAAMDKWLALPPKAPKAMLDVYRGAYGRMAHDPDFIDRGRKISDDFVPLSSGDVEALVNTLGSTPPQAIEYISMMLRRQGLEVQ